jgi:1-acylglycerone phosphate reductase
VLVNNAGAEFVCPLLDVDIAESKKLYDVNVWGPLAMVQAFAPLLIEAKGVISNHTSVSCVLPLVWSGAFHPPLAQKRKGKQLRANKPTTRGLF